MSQTLLPLAGFEVTFNGRFWVTAEDEGNRNRLCWYIGTYQIKL